MRIARLGLQHTSLGRAEDKYAPVAEGNARERALKRAVIVRDTIVPPPCWTVFSSADHGLFFSFSAAGATDGVWARATPPRAKPATRLRGARRTVGLGASLFPLSSVQPSYGLFAWNVLRMKPMTRRMSSEFRTPRHGAMAVPGFPRPIASAISLSLIRVIA
jgi:hypothetical protein